MAMSSTFAKAMIENNTVTLPIEEAKSLLMQHKPSDHFVAATFQGLYYTDEENELIDILRSNIADIKEPYKHAIAMTCLLYTSWSTPTWSQRKTWPDRLLKTQFRACLKIAELPTFQTAPSGSMTKALFLRKNSAFV